MDEVFGESNFCSLIAFETTTGQDVGSYVSPKIMTSFYGTLKITRMD